MSKLRVVNVGPIKGGFKDDQGFLNVSEITIFIGNQGTGKSTIAKIYSTMSWVEKALVRGDFNANYLTQYKRFEKQLAYQNISNYITDKSEIEYIGAAYRILYKNRKLTVSDLKSIEKYNFPKIMYVPAERNFVSSVDKPDLIKRLPLPLYEFLEEYEEAKQNFTKGVSLPIGGLKFEYKKQNKKSWLIGSDYQIELLEASSGFQSLVPLFIVTINLANIINKENSGTRKEISFEEEQKIKKEVKSIYDNKKISDDVRKVLLERLSKKHQYSCFINIVEEPEQNLYPLSQKEVLFQLIESRNQSKNSQLIMTTHSPYIINYLTLCIKADFVKSKVNQSINKNKLLEKLNNVVPLGSTVSSSIVSIYQIKEDGSVEKLPDYNGLPSDENFLNEFLEKSNEQFIELLEIEEECR